jgi:multicomponent Na+:H+ antiporter subunit E
MKVRPWLVAGVFFAILWVFVRGASLTPQVLFTTFLVGLAVGMPVAYVFRRLYEEPIDLTRLLRAIPYVLAYAAVFSREVVVANLDVAYRVLNPRMPLEPQVILVPLRVETALGVTTLANSITITPGTITLDHDPEENALYVHIIDGRHPAEIVEPIRTWERYALFIFDESTSPDTPPPGFRVHPPGGPPEPKTVSEAAENESDEVVDGDTSGERTGDISGERTGDTSGERTGDTSGEQTGDTSGEQTGDTSGEQTGGTSENSTDDTEDQQ